MALHYKVFGQGPALVILHGLFGSLDNWQLHAKALAATHRVHIVDLRNHGGSPHYDRHTYADMAQDILAFMDAEGLAQAAVLGHSMGGKVAMQLAAEAPGRVSQLVVADMAPKAYPRHHDTILRALNTLPLHAITTRQAAEAHLAAQGIASAGERAFLLKGLDRDAQQRFRWKFNLPVLTRDYDQILAPIYPAEPVPVPALFVYGEASQYVQPGDHAAIRALFPGARLVGIAGAGHWVHADAPAAFLAAVQGWLAGA